MMIAEWPLALLNGFVRLDGTPLQRVTSQMPLKSSGIIVMISASLMGNSPIMGVFVLRLYFVRSGMRLT